MFIYFLKPFPKLWSFLLKRWMEGYPKESTAGRYTRGYPKGAERSEASKRKKKNVIQGTDRSRPQGGTREMYVSILHARFARARLPCASLRSASLASLLVLSFGKKKKKILD